MLISQSQINKIIIIDVLDEYEGFLICYDFESLAEYIKDKDEYKISCRFTDETDIEYLFKLLEYERNCLLVMEECSAYIAPRQQATNFLRLVNFGRHWDTYIIGISRRTAELSAQMRAMTDVVYSFKQTEPMDLQKMNALGFNNLDLLESFDYIKDQGIPKENVHFKKIIL